MDRPRRFRAHTLQFRVPDIEAGTKFYTEFFGREPDFSPHIDFKEWELADGAWFQLGEGEPKPAYPIRFAVSAIEADRKQLKERFGIVCDEIRRIPGLVAYCNFEDPWGNRFGFYQRLYKDKPRTPGGRERDSETGTTA
jgi:predicted enzyme related to lactoylglutathione lyase